MHKAAQNKISYDLSILQRFPLKFWLIIG